MYLILFLLFLYRALQMDQDFMKQHRKSCGQKEGKLSSKTKTQRNILMILVASLKVGGRRHSCKGNSFCNPFLKVYFLFWNTVDNLLNSLFITVKSTCICMKIKKMILNYYI